MINKRNILRQVIDIQVQADRLIKAQADITEIEDFAKYSFELKTFLRKNIEDDFILKYVDRIPILCLDEETVGPDSFVNIILSFFGGLFGGYSLEQKKKSEALDVIRDIKGKYAAAEFMLKNYFD